MKQICGCGYHLERGVQSVTDKRPRLLLMKRLLKLGIKEHVMIRVKNKKTDIIYPLDVYVGRPSKWGNPFSHLLNSNANYRTASREDSIDAYREWIVTQSGLMASLHELRGRNLVCWCAPKACHANVLLELANKEF